MKNTEIILNAAISNEIITLTDAEKLIQKYGDLPIHTYQHWKEIGYQVRKGEHAAFKALLWKLAKGKKQAEDPGDDGDGEQKQEKRKMILTRAALFTWKQVDKIEESDEIDEIIDEIIVDKSYNDLPDLDLPPAPDPVQAPAPAPEKKIAPAKKKTSSAKSKKLETKTLTKEEREKNLKKIIDTPVIIVPKKDTPDQAKEEQAAPKKSLSIEDCEGENNLLYFKWDHGTLKGEWKFFMSAFFPMSQKDFKIILNDMLTAPNKDQVIQQVTNYLMATKMYNAANYTKSKLKMLDANIKQIAAIA